MDLSKFKWAIRFFLMAMAFASLLLILMALVSCKSLKLYSEEGQPFECNDWFTAMDYSLKNGVKDNTLVTLQWQKCWEARVEFHNRDCARWIFEDGVVDKKKYPQYAYYLECRKMTDKKKE